MRYFWEDCGVPILVIAALMAGIAAGVFGIVAWECASYETVTGKPTRMAAGSCYIRDDGQWYQWEEYKHRFVARGKMEVK